ncbi:DUF418 domain-containing protein [Nocardia sp. NPDC020380]|uniref:DUF418 domain-containing protein n=1 Tax=Nocardia sp. NPDC020380 TaxID=3364309 RepID=UPI0037AB3BEB
MRRLPSLDILRGFALCGILFANAPAILHLSWTRNGSVDPMVRWLEFTVHGRFFPLFSVLFGVSFALMWRSASMRARSPRIVMLRRILVTGVLGALHQLLQPGEALLPYAIVALTLLLPATFLPNRWAGPVTGLVGALLTAWAATGTNGLLAVPGLFLLGFAAGTIGMPQRLERIDSQMLLLGLVLLVPAVVGALILQSAHPGFGVAAGLVMALTYAGVVLMLLGNRSHGPAAKVLAALGRTALTNYLLATVIVVAVRFFAPQLGLAPEDRTAWALTLLLCVLILTTQAALSLWWLDHFHQGPVEWLVRHLTWTGAAPATAAAPATTATSGTAAAPKAAHGPLTAVAAQGYVSVERVNGTDSGAR